MVTAARDRYLEVLPGMGQAPWLPPALRLGNGEPETRYPALPHCAVAPEGGTPPLPEKQGWWKHGSTNAKMGPASGRLPGEVRLQGLRGSGGMTAPERRLRSWRLAPGWLRRRVPEGTPIRRGSHGWYDDATGELHG